MKSYDPNPSTLVIGYGNDLRGDDGIGPAVVERVQQLRLPNVQVLSCHQLTPELAETIAGTARLILVDAALSDQASIQVRKLSPAASSAGLTHVCQPSALLNLASTLYGQQPPAWSVTVPGSCFDVGAEFSSRALQGIEAAVEAVLDLCAPHQTRATELRSD